MRIAIYAGFGVVVGILSLGGLSQAGGDELPIKIITTPKPTAPQKERILVIQTDAGAMCLGNVYSKVNPNNRAKLALKNVDREGKAAWTWPIDAERSKGAWNLSLQCATHKKDGDIRTMLDFPE